MNVRSRSVPLLVLLVAAALLALWWVRPADGAKPPGAAAASPVAGKVTYANLDSGNVTLPIRSFSWQVEQTGTGGGGGGGGTGKAVFSPPRWVEDVSARSPLIWKRVAAGTHLVTITVVLYRPGTTTVQQRWTFSDVVISATSQSKTGVGNPTETIEAQARQVEQTTYAADGVTESRTACWDIAGNVAC